MLAVIITLMYFFHSPWLLCLDLGTYIAEMSTSEIRGATPRPRGGGCTSAGELRGATPRSRSGGAAVRRYPSSKVRSSICALLEQL